MTYFVLAYLFTWSVWGLEIAHAHGWIGFVLPDTLAYLGITIAAIVTTSLAGGWKGLGAWIARLGRWRVGPQWYAVALLGFAVIALAALGIFVALGGTPQIGVVVPLSFVPLLLIDQIVLHLIGEEAGWRGVALPALQSRLSALGASLVLGLLWGLWHMPLWFIPGSHQASMPFLGFMLLVPAVSILITWIYNHTRGSVLLTALFHAGMNTSTPYFNSFWSDVRLFWLTVAVAWVAALVVVFWQGAAHLSRRPVARTATALLPREAPGAAVAAATATASAPAR